MMGIAMVAPSVEYEMNLRAPGDLGSIVDGVAVEEGAVWRVWGWVSFVVGEVTVVGGVVRGEMLALEGGALGIGAPGGELRLGRSSRVEGMVVALLKKLVGVRGWEGSSSM